MNRRSFLNLGLKGAIIGFALSSGVTGARLKLVEQERISRSDQLGQRSHIDGNAHTLIIRLPNSYL